MPEFIVTLEGTLVEQWRVFADCEEDAAEAVLGGAGDWMFNEWHGKPEATARPVPKA